MELQGRHRKVVGCVKTFLTIRSENSKTGPIPVSTSSAKTCPSSCTLRNNGCYAEYGPIAWFWDRVTHGEVGMEFKDFLQAISRLPQGQLWRHNQAGDLPGRSNRIDPAMLAALVNANRGRRGFTFTHKPPTPENLKAIRSANAGGFTINLSANSPAHADVLAGTKAGPVVTVLPKDAPLTSYTPKGRKIVVCPAQWKEYWTCANCQLCQRTHRSVIVGFRAHGTSAKSAHLVAGGAP